MKKLFIYICAIGLFSTSSCEKSYLDIVPDNIATIENAFTRRANAERFLFSVYSYMPQHSNFAQNPAFTSGDEFWLHENYITPGWEITRGNQNVVDPYLNYWQGTRGARDLYQAISDANVFLDNIDMVPDLEQFEREQWIAEVKFLKAYYHFYLIRMYGPIPLKKVNLPINAGVQEVKVPRDPVDEGFDYVVQLLDEATPHLPTQIFSEASELGRITQPIALAVKAYVLVTAASPLFNGNQDYANFTNSDGTLLFNPTFEIEKWEKARDAAREAIDAAESNGHRLYYYSQSGRQYDVSEEIRVQMNIRNSVTESWNDEVIWGNSNSMTNNLQRQSTPRGLDPARRANAGARGNAAVPLKVAEVFYTENGVPINEDRTWDYGDRFELREGTEDEQYYIEQGYTTAAFNFEREPRYYADLGFDGGVWYGQGRYDDTDTWFVSAKKGDPASNVTQQTFNVTGIWAKKLVNYLNTFEVNTYTVEMYPWPVMRLGNLYLLYAEALNEVQGPSNEVYQWLDLIRDRAGLEGVVESWVNYSINPNKPANQDGLREIIHQERLIELAFEGQRYWDLRRWKKATEELNEPITGWDIEQRTAEGYYRERFIFDQAFSLRDYLWPIRENELLANKNTVQNPGW
jgi:hypothetical protein